MSAARKNRQMATETGAKSYTTLANAALRAGEAPVYRVWLAARFLDSAGSGWCEISALRDTLSGNDSPLRCMSWRRLCQIFGEGEGRYWTFETGRNGVDRLRYASPARLADALETGRPDRVPVLIPPDMLTAEIGDFEVALVAVRPSDPQ